MSHLRAQTGNLKAKRKSCVKLWQSARWHRMTPLQRSALYTAGNPVETHVKRVGLWEIDCTRILLGYYMDIIYSFYTDIRSIIFFHFSTNTTKQYLFKTITYFHLLSLRYSTVFLAAWYSISFMVQHRLWGTASDSWYSIGFAALGKIQASSLALEHILVGLMIRRCAISGSEKSLKSNFRRQF